MRHSRNASLRCWKTISKCGALGTLGEINATEHRIELKPGTKLIRQLPFLQGLHKHKVTEAAIKEMLKQGVIEEANTEWASPVVLAPKSNRSHRF